MKTIRHAFLIAIALILLFGSTSSAQDEAKNTGSEAKEAIAKELAEIQTLLDGDEYAKIAERMTTDAQNELAVSVVTSAVNTVEMSKQLKEKLGAMTGQLGLGSTKKLEGLLKEHKFDEMGIGADFEVMVQQGGSMPNELPGKTAESKEANDKEKAKDSEPTEKTESKPTAAKQPTAEEKLNAKILEALDKGKKRWEIVSAIAKENDSPFGSFDLITGEVTDIKFGKDNANAQVTIKGKAPESKEGGGVQLMIKAPIPSVVIELLKLDGKWVHNGIDATATAALPVEEPEMPSFDGPRRRRSDF